MEFVAQQYGHVVFKFCQVDTDLQLYEFMICNGTYFRNERV